MLTALFSYPFFSSKRGEQAGLAAILVLLLFIALPLINTWLTIRTTHRTVTPAPPLTFASIQNIPGWHLFGKASDEKNIPLTTLNLQLLGIFYQPDQSAGAVIISDAGQPGKLYKVGDNIPQGASLVKILRYSILLNNNGRVERLLLPFKKLPLQKSK